MSTLDRQNFYAAKCAALDAWGAGDDAETLAQCRALHAWRGGVS